MTSTDRPAAAAGDGVVVVGSGVVGTTGRSTMRLMSTVRGTAVGRTGRAPGHVNGNGPRWCRGTVRRETVVPAMMPTTGAECRHCCCRQRCGDCCGDGGGDGGGGFGLCGFYSSRLHLDPAVTVSYCRHWRHCQDI